MTAFVSAEPFHPGEFLKDELEARGWTQEDFSEVTGISRRQIINLLQGKSGVTPDTATRIADAFDQDASVWMHYQLTYELATAAKQDREVQRRAYAFSKVPVRELRLRGWIKDTTDAAELENQICGLLGIKSIKDSPSLSVAAKKSTEYAFTNPSQLAWYCCVRKMGEHTAAADYREDLFEDGINELRKLASNVEDVRRVPPVLAQMGIRLVFIEHFQKTKIDGVAMWLEGDRPVIGISLRFARIDNFWFTLFHELVHIKYKDAAPVDENLCEPAGEGETTAIEERANREASDYLVDSEKLASFIVRHTGLYYETEIVRFAQSREVHPGIVVGQLQCRNELSYKQFRKYLPLDRGLLIGQALTDGWGTVLELGEK